MLFAKLDTLTHFHYTPKTSKAEVKIVRNAPTLAMEEVAPVAMSDAQLLAPQEVVDKRRGEDIGVGEKADTDKKRDRRKKKASQRAKAQVLTLIFSIFFFSIQGKFWKLRALRKMV